VGGEARVRQICRFGLAYSKHCKRFVRQHTEEHFAIAIQDWILEPRRLPRIVLKESARQCLSKSTDREMVQLPRRRSSGKIVDGPAVHPLANGVTPSVRLYQREKLQPQLFARSRVAVETINGEFVGALLSAPLEQLPGLAGRQLTRDYVAFDQTELPNFRRAAATISSVAPSMPSRSVLMLRS
jgi:hypothetical protein